MPRFYPESIVKSFRPKSEEKVFDIIKTSFSDDWVVFHSFDYVNRLDSGVVQDGEVDFILYHKNYGLLVLEVKGGAIRYSDGVWYSGQHRIAPYQQVRKNKYAIRSLLCRKGEKFPSISISHAVCFPDIHLKGMFLPPEAEGITLTASDFDTFEKKCIKIMRARPVFANADVVPIGYDEVIEKLSPKFDFTYTLKDEIDRDRRTFLRLSALQYEAFGMLKNFKRLNIRGCAGAGKTVIAVKLAEELANQGKKVLVLCFNKILANRLQKAICGNGNV